MTTSILAIIVPCYNEEEVIEKSNKVFIDVLKKMINEGIISNKSYICYVNDGSQDKTWNIIKELIKHDDNIKGISFARNFGHQNAMHAGLMTCKADVYITIDADLQEDPYAMVEMVKKYHEGYNIVYGVRKGRKDKFLKKILSNIFYKLMDKLGSKAIKNSSEYRLISKKVVEELRELPDRNIYLRSMIAGTSFQYEKVMYNRTDRVAGESKYPYSLLYKTAIMGLISSSNNLLSMILPFSFIFLLLFLISIIILLIDFFIYFSISSSLLIVSVGMLICFLNLFAIGIIAEYIGKIFIEVKHRPLYVIGEDLTK